MRPLVVDDLEALAPIDRAAAGRVGSEPLLTPGGMAFYARTGHAFVAETEDGPRGFCLAQAIWDGRRPTLRLAALRVADEDDAEARAAMLEAVTKSAYDAAVYDLVAEVPEDDAAVRALLRREGWRPESVRPFRRTLGTRGAAS